MHSRNLFSAGMLLGAALLPAGLCAMPGVGRAYEMTGVGGKLGIISPEDRDETLMLGGHLEFEEPDSRLHLVPNLMFWSSDNTSDVNPNFDVYYHFSSQSQVTPYLGGGIGLHVMSSETSAGANLFGGLRFPGGSNHYFVEGRYTASSVSQAAILGGITFPMH